MLKRLNPEISLGFVVASLFWIAVLGWQSSYSLPENEKQRCYEEAKKAGHKDEECKTFWERTTTDPVAFFTFTLTIVTLALGAISVRQFHYLKRSDETARIAANAAAQSAEAQIAVEGARLTCLPTSSSYWNEIGQWADRWPNSPDMPLRRTFAVFFALKNYGKTPATIAGVNARLTRSPEAPSDIYIESPFLDLPAEIVVGAGLRSEGEFKVEFSQFFRLEEAIQVQNGEMNIWFNGRIIYDDVFGRVGTQVFLYKVRSHGGFTPIWDQTTYRQK